MSYFRNMNIKNCDFNGAGLKNAGFKNVSVKNVNPKKAALKFFVIAFTAILSSNNFVIAQNASQNAVARGKARSSISSAGNNTSNATGNNTGCENGTKRDFKGITSKIAYFSCAVINGQISKVKKLIDSGANITQVNKTNTSSTTLFYDTLFIKDETARNKIFDMLLTEILKQKYDAERQEFLNKKNYKDVSEKSSPKTALEKSFSLGYLDISEKLIAAGATCDDSDDCELNMFYAMTMVKLRRAIK